MTSTQKSADSLGTFTIAFYNTENLFDIYNDRSKHDRDYLPNSERRWTKKRYQNKLDKISLAISKIGETKSEDAPSIIGLAEVENGKVIRDLLDTTHLKGIPYGFVHFNSKDERGMDVALIYNTTEFTVTHSEIFELIFERSEGGDDFTRDVLLVTGSLKGETISILVNHWASRREGTQLSEVKRLQASEKVSEIIKDIQTKQTDAKIIIMGDFNDDPHCKSITQLTENNNVFNPMNTLQSYNRGSLVHQRKWHLFDQIMFTMPFFESRENHLEFDSANIFDADFLKEYKGRHKGTPFRTYAGNKHKGGYSDHFPVYMTLKK
ncbi:Endonuclease/Exonuclease/phosphatase family protein [Bizionia echini]|uniref:Endonuclease/Exonuclease/phosphatase family protein n=1 Tax=Bizionia echini TaxID=649333 RepID=A0A1I4Z2H1_9FLAO|nr:endonuclease [Bizionia echini]SFN44100.1 Endonuclease/Exonuclease/phosphatase family protein [Bizionia echini]